MMRLVKNESLGRLLRCDEPVSECGVSSYTKLKDLLDYGKFDEAKMLIAYLQLEYKFLHDLYCDWVYADLQYIATNYGETELPKVLRNTKNHMDKIANKNQEPLSKKNLVYFLAEAMRAHRSGPMEEGNIKVWEEEERFVIELDPCGSGGRMRRIGEVDGTPPRTEDPFKLGCTSKAYPWSWGKSGVIYYCLHCCIWHEQMAIEKTGFPLKITEYPDDPYMPCRNFIYKDSNDIPEKYFKRIGKKKPRGA